MNIDTRNNIISIVLFIVIIVLSWTLYDAITGPYQLEQDKKAVTRQVRNRMINVRDVLIRYQIKNSKFPDSIDEVIEFIKADSTLLAKADSLYKELPPLKFSLEQMIYSPRTNKKFYYTKIDSIRPNLYVLRDPDSKDVIGDSVKTTLLNAASWE